MFWLDTWQWPHTPECIFVNTLALLLCICFAALEVQGGQNLELLLKEATEAYRMGDYSRALALCQPVSFSFLW